MKRFWMILTTLVMIRARTRSWAYVGVLCFEAVVELWRIAVLGPPVSGRAVALVVMLAAQICLPMLLLWATLSLFYLGELVAAVFQPYYREHYAFLVFYVIPCLAVLWARPRNRRRAVAAT